MHLGKDEFTSHRHHEPQSGRRKDVTTRIGAVFVGTSRRRATGAGGTTGEHRCHGTISEELIAEGAR